MNEKLCEGSYTDLVPLLVVGAAAAEPLLLVAEERGGGEQDDRQHEGEQAAGHHARDVRGPGHQRGGRRDGEGQVSTLLHIVTSTQEAYYRARAGNEPSRSLNFYNHGECSYE